MSRGKYKSIRKTAMRCAVSFAAVAGLYSPVMAQERAPTWSADAEQMCQPAGQKAQNPVVEIKIDNVKEILSYSPQGKALLDYAQSKNIAICLKNDEDGRAGYFLHKHNLLVLDSSIDNIQLVKIMAHELRHVWQENEGYFVDTNLEVSHAILMGKTMEADSEAFTALVLYEIEQAGHDVSSAYKDHKQYTAVHEAFRGVMSAYKNEPLEAKKHAMRAAFDAWFKLDVAGLRYETVYLKSYERIMRWSPAHYKISYNHEQVTAEKLTAIGELPDGSNYISDTGGIRLDDSRYRSLRPENEVKLSQLQFEIEWKQRDYCATKVGEDAQRWCQDYPTKTYTVAYKK